MNPMGRTGTPTGTNSTGGYKFGKPGGYDKTPRGYKERYIDQFTPEQHQLYQQMFGHVSPDSYLSRLAQGDEGIFNEIEAPEKRNYNALVGNLGSRFAGFGTGGLKSSGAQNYMTSAASNFAQDLASKRQGLSRQALQDLMSYSNTLLGQRPYEHQLIEKAEKEKSPWGSLIGGVAGGIGGAFIGMPAQGAVIGSSVGGMF
jgi:hypothetical protein